jgi:poly-gamma-glutamate synthase PgsB/CapB
MRSLFGGPVWGEHLSDPKLFVIALVVLVGCMLWLGVAAWRHRRHLHVVPLRIHVAGTRGKSTTTRLIAAGLRAGGRRVMAKTTGAEPRLILPDGSEQAWPRRGPASVREQVRLFARAVESGADTVVAECMAIRPELVWASETHLVKATMSVITNARADHFEDLGENPDAAAEAVRWVVPAAGQLVVAAEAASSALRSWAARRGTTVTVVNTAGLGPLAADRVLALAVCSALGIPAEIAGPAMDAAGADPGSFFERTLTVGGKPVHFVNAFACNDVDSLALLWPTVQASSPPVVLMNARRDRPLRTRSFVRFLAAQVPMPMLFVTGDPLAIRLARRTGFPLGGVRPLRARTPAAALAELAAATPSGGTIWGVGNYHGSGGRLLAALTEPGSTC